MNTCDLLWLWRLCCVYSAHDLFHNYSPEYDNITFVNYSRVRALMGLILESTSTYTKSGSLGPEELRRIFDDTVDLMDDEDALAELMASNRTSRAKWGFTRFMVRLSGTQISDQDHGFGRDAGRLIAFWEKISVDGINYIPDPQRKRVLEVSRRIPQVLGAPISSLALVALFIHHFYQGKYKKISGVFPNIPMKEKGKGELRAQKLRNLLEMLEGLSYQDDWEFAQQDLMEAWPIEGQELNAYLRLFSKNARELRDLSKSDKLLKTGHFSRELSALDCFPLVELENGCFIAPNIRLIFRSFASGIDFTLLDELGDEYSHARGALQEAYLHRLMEESLDEVEIIPERTYGKEERRGPDLTLLEKSNRSMLVIESKSRRISARTRFQLTEEILDGNLASAYEALQKLPKKIEALHGSLSEYSDVQTLIDSTKVNEPICVVVLSDSLMRMSELVRLSMEGDPEHFLNGYPYRFCILGIETFERAVTLAGSQNIPLYSLLAEHYEKCGETAMADASADRFSSHKGGRCEFPIAFLKAALRKRVTDRKA